MSTALVSRRLGLVGRVLGHSLSPAMMSSWLTVNAPGSTYSLFESEPEQLLAFLESLQTAGVTGLNVTIPYKVKCFEFVDRPDEYASITKSVNCILMRDGKKLGYNWDCLATQRSLEQAPQLSRYSSAYVLGAGGAARAAVVALQKTGVERVVVKARRPEECEWFVSMGAAVEPWGPVDGLVVNATSLGMASNPWSSSPVPGGFSETSLMLDMVYGPGAEPLRRAVVTSGGTYLSGLLPLAIQAALSLEAWFGVPVDWRPLADVAFASGGLVPRTL